MKRVREELEVSLLQKAFY